MTAAVRAELLQLEPVGVVAPVLLRDVVAVLALLASQRDLGPDIGGSHDGVPFCTRAWVPDPGFARAGHSEPLRADGYPHVDNRPLSAISSGDYGKPT